ncbi:hypothetical protein ACQ859_02885 [Roseateles chitinivorans]|uniref:hypothetical protein n=1 Tax=Roseateles chitinivorans TaxID=2917965 RepID=UPI003D6792ED
MKYSTRRGAAGLGLSLMSLSVSLAWAATPDAGQLLNEQRRLTPPAQRGDLDRAPAVNAPWATTSRRACARASIASASPGPTA